MERIIRKIASEAGDITLIRLVNDHGAWVELSTLGAGIVGLGVPDKQGNIENVALCYANPADYLNDGPCMGKIPGRYANRIAKGHFSIDGKEYSLAVNNGPNALHGGPTGFQNRIWEYSELPNGVRFTYRSADGEEGYPGNVEVKADYIWTENDILDLYLRAVTDAPTVINLTNHCYWNLRGATSGSVLGHELRLNASRWLPTDDTLIPTGELAAVEGTPMDLRGGVVIGEGADLPFEALRLAGGYDHNWAVNGRPGVLRPAARAESDETGVRMEVLTTQPGVQLYTGNGMDGFPRGKGGAPYARRWGFCLETQAFPNAVNQPNFPSPVLKKGEEYRHKTVFRFSVSQA